MKDTYTDTDVYTDSNRDDRAEKKRLEDLAWCIRSVRNRAADARRASQICKQRNIPAYPHMRFLVEAHERVAEIYETAAAELETECGK